MLLAVQTQFPESLYEAFVISNLLCGLAIGSVSPVLLQVTVGVGLPLAEQ